MRRIARLRASPRRVYLVTVTGPSSHPKIKVQNTRLRACAESPRQHAPDRLVPVLARARQLVLRPHAPHAEGPGAYASYLYIGTLLGAGAGSVDSARWPARAAEGTRLESVWRGNSPEGSNPSATANRGESIAQWVNERVTCIPTRSYNVSAPVRESVDNAVWS